MNALALSAQEIGVQLLPASKCHGLEKLADLKLLFRRLHLKCINGPKARSDLESIIVIKMNSNDLTIAQQKQFDLVSFRVSWSQAVLFGCYEVRL